LKTPSGDIAFIIGSGRSGTHWLAAILNSSDDTTVTVEKIPIYNMVLEMAFRPSSRTTLFPKLCGEYRRELSLSGTRLYIDKSHQNMWLVEELADAFPRSRFIAIRRQPYAVVASMLQHSDPVDSLQNRQSLPKPESILEWHHRWREFPVPNRFLGITAEMARNYDEFSMAKRCALRWTAHNERLDYLASQFEGKLHVIEFENLVEQSSIEVSRLEDFCGIRGLVVEEKRESLDKWRSFLTREQRAEIAEVTGLMPGSYM
jgi:hypothetical protein